MVYEINRVQPKAKIPKSIFQALKIEQDARFYDYQYQYQQAIINYMQAAKIIIRLLKKYPKMPFHKQFAYEAQLCLQRVKQLKPCLRNYTPSSSNFIVTSVNPKAEEESL